MKVIYNDELYGKLEHNEERNAWKKTEPYILSFNGNEYSISFYIEFMDILYTEMKYNINQQFKMEDFTDKTIERAEKWETEQRELYKKYLIAPNKMMKLVEEEIVRDFLEKRATDYDDDFCVRYLGEKVVEKIKKAEKQNEILSLVMLKEITLFSDRIRILGTNVLYPDFGINVSPEGFVDVGLEENMY